LGVYKWAFVVEQRDYGNDGINVDDEVGGVKLNVTPVGARHSTPRL
jgi:hypothetical protein